MTQTTTHQGKPTAWRPKKGQWFNAYVREYNKLHVSGPFKRTDDGGIEAQKIISIDADGDPFEFKLAEFRLEPINNKTKGEQNVRN